MVTSVVYRALPTVAWSALPIAADLLAHQLFFKKSSHPQIGRTLVGTVTAIAAYRLTAAKLLAPLLYLAFKIWQFFGENPAPSGAGPDKLVEESPSLEERVFPSKNPPSSDALPAESKAPPGAPAPLALDQEFTKVLNRHPKAIEELTSLLINHPTLIAKFSAAALAGNASNLPSVDEIDPELRQKVIDIFNKYPQMTDDLQTVIATETGASSTEESRVLAEEWKKVEQELQKEKQARTKVLQEMWDKAIKINVTVQLTVFAHEEEDKTTHVKTQIPEKQEAEKNLIFRFSTASLFKFDKATADCLRTGKRKIDVTEKTPFVWVDLGRENGEKVGMVYEFFPVAFLKTLTKKKTVLVIVDDKRRVEIEFLRSGFQTVEKKLEKITDKTPVKPIMGTYVVGKLRPKTESEEKVTEIEAELTASATYLKPLEVQVIS